MLHLPQEEDLTDPLPHQQVADLLPGEPQAQNGPQVVPVGQLFISGGDEGEGGDGGVLVGGEVLRFHPVGQEGDELPLGPLPAAPEEVGRVAAGGDEPLRRLLLGQGEEEGVGGDGAVLGELQLVHHPGQHQPFVGVGGELGEELRLIHRPSPRRHSGRR